MSKTALFGRLSRIVSVGLIAVLFAVPFAWMVRTALSPAQAIFSRGGFDGVAVTLEHFVRVLRSTQIGRYLVNGAIVTTLILAGQLAVAIPAGYALGRYRFAGDRAVVAVVIAGIVFPGFIAAVPNFLLLARLQLIDTRIALILPFWGSAFGVFLFRQAIRRIPSDYHDAAVIDGCTTLQTITRVSIPLIAPAVSAFSIFSVVIYWNELFWPLIVIRSSRLFTPPAGVLFFASSEIGIEWGPTSAAAMIVVLPLVILYLSLRRQVEEGLAATILK